MTNEQRSTPSFPRRLAPALVAAALGILALAGPGTTADAAYVRSSSATVAATAGAALNWLTEWETTRDPAAYVAYLQARDETAVIAAGELGLDGEAMREAWLRAEPVKQEALLAALSQLGVPYRSMMSKEGVGFDCSGLTSYAWARAGVQLARPSSGQIREATRVSHEQAEAGDLVYYPGHVSMYLGVGDAIVHSPNSGHEVEITFVSARRAKSVVYGDPTG